ncbi:hypothetical protein [Niameybacter massiliensis]|uniref:hypothetical protein n=1 Tax=Niameybacter massiliensis TaxID=1658108 RepID=UPI0006B4F8BE|nr:hypothetical protein [Niameybacter massiliensis]
MLSFVGSDLYFPICNIDAIKVYFEKQEDLNNFITSIQTILNYTLCCQKTCEATVDLDNNGEPIIKDPLSPCSYEYYASCKCATGKSISCSACISDNASCCDCVAQHIDLCQFNNCPSERLRKFFLKQQFLLNQVGTISTNMVDILPSSPLKNIAASGLSTVVLTYQESKTNKYVAAIVCLKNVTAVEFTRS